MLRNEFSSEALDISGLKHLRAGWAEFNDMSNALRSMFGDIKASFVFLGGNFNFLLMIRGWIAHYLSLINLLICWFTVILGFPMIVLELSLILKFIFLLTNFLRLIGLIHVPKGDWTRVNGGLTTLRVTLWSSRLPFILILSCGLKTLLERISIIEINHFECKATCRRYRASRNSDEVFLSVISVLELAIVHCNSSFPYKLQVSRYAWHSWLLPSFCDDLSSYL